MEGDGHGFVGIGAEAQGKVVYGTFLAVEYKGVGLLMTFKAVRDGLESVCAIYPVKHTLYGCPVIHSVHRIIAFVKYLEPLVFRYAFEQYVVHQYFGLGEVHCRRVLADGGDGLACHFPGNGLEFFLVVQGVLVSLVYDVIDALVIERQHIVAGELVMDVHIQHFHSRPGGSGGQEGDGLEKEVDGGVELVDFPAYGHIRADHYVRTHLFGQVHREVVAHSSIQENLAAAADGPEIERNGHCGTQGGGYASVSPVFGGHSVQVRGYVGVGDWQVCKADAVLVSDAHGAEHIADVEAIKIAVRHSQPHLVQRFLKHVGGTGARFFGHPFQKFLLLQASLYIFVVIVVGDTDHIRVAVLLDLVSYIRVGDIVRHHHRPVYGAYQGVKLVVLVTHRVQASDKAAHTGAGYDVNGDAKLFHVFNHAQVGKAACAASGKHQAHRGAVLAYGIHPLPHLGKCQGVSFRGCTLENLCVCGKRKAQGCKYRC